MLKHSSMPNKETWQCSNTAACQPKQGDAQTQQHANKEPGNAQTQQHAIHNKVMLKHSSMP
jgi:hypothetical protein